MTWEAPASKYVAQFLGGDATADLEPARKRPESFQTCGLVAWTEHNDVPTAERITPVEFREPGAGLFRNKVGAQFLCIEAAANDLLYPAFM